MTGFSGSDGAGKSAGGVPAMILSMEVGDKKQLQLLYMRFLTNGGIFIPTDNVFRLGEDVHLMLRLPKEDTQYAIIGVVVWVTPAHAGNKRVQGVGIHFGVDDECLAARKKIEEMLGAALKSDKPTYTI